MYQMLGVAEFNDECGRLMYFCRLNMSKAYLVAIITQGLGASLLFTLGDFVGVG